MSAVWESRVVHESGTAYALSGHWHLHGYADTVFLRHF